MTAKHHHYVSPNNYKERLQLLKVEDKVWVRVYLKCLKAIAGVFQGAVQGKDGP